MPNKKEAIGYLPDERPPIWKLLLYAVQQFVVMFPATITVALRLASTSQPLSLPVVLQPYSSSS